MLRNGRQDRHPPDVSLGGPVEFKTQDNDVLAGVDGRVAETVASGPGEK